jgi:hypothetical protein
VNQRKVAWFTAVFYMMICGGLQRENPGFEALSVRIILRLDTRPWKALDQYPQICCENTKATGNKNTSA